MLILDHGGTKVRGYFDHGGAYVERFDHGTIKEALLVIQGGINEFEQ